MIRKLLPAVLTLAALTSARLGAQSNLSTQGFGFPTGQFSTRAEGTGGAIGEIDPLSPVNPAAISLLTGRTFYFQAEPEYRTVTTANGSEKTTTARYPNVFGAIPLGSRWVMSLGASTMLDRSATTTFSTTQVISPTEAVPMTTEYAVSGAMDDIRLALAWAPVNWLRLGVGAHDISGHNLISLTQTFADTVTYATFTEDRVLGFAGVAASGGIQIVTSQISASLSGRVGGSVNLHAEDTLLSKGKVPSHVGASIAYTGLPNTAIAIRTSKDDWSSLGPLGSPGLKGVDAWDSSIGADVAGPKIGNRVVYLRGGYRTRTLPFQADGFNVKENSISGGLGTTFSDGRVITDLAVIHADRSADGLDASEHALTISFGITIRP